MRLSRVSIRHFRNITESAFEPDARLNFLSGENGQGKTSVLESIGLLASLRSFRKAKTPDLVQRNEQSADLRCLLVSDEEGHHGWKTELQVVLHQTPTHSSKTAFINGKASPSSSHYFGQRFGQFKAGFHSVVFNPSDHELVRGEPKLRRDFLNQVISAEDLEYFSALKKYQRVLEQRNSVLKSENHNISQALAPFTDQFVELATLLTWKRLQWLERLSQLLNPALVKIAPKQASLGLIYDCSWVPKNNGFSFNNKSLDEVYFAGQGHVPSIEELVQEFRQRLSAMERLEWRAQSSLLGPHRDDWILLLGDQPLKARGSQGEVRSSLLALKLCEIDIFRERTGLRPVFLLDDFSSELDRNRRSFLLEYILGTDLQVFVTATENIPSSGKHFRVSAGQILVTE